MYKSMPTRRCTIAYECTCSFFFVRRQITATTTSKWIESISMTHSSTFCHFAAAAAGLDCVVLFQFLSIMAYYIQSISTQIITVLFPYFWTLFLKIKKISLWWRTFLTFSIADLEFSNASKQAARFAIGHPIAIVLSWWLPSVSVTALPSMQSTTDDGGFFRRKYRDNNTISSTVTIASHEQLIFVNL